ncbi:hypothetical protein FRX31_006075 [Thalictrum thalictroides]|uniref:Uncharacterized protein n=1 Tax=Thalictrum thalictroides TaxID=46969 RepID=A0A7J6X648_THATH|nr:hypothetical protein FRX31_006075 [Thalictrum thalictroides]
MAVFRERKIRRERKQPGDFLRKNDSSLEEIPWWFFEKEGFFARGNTLMVFRENGIFRERNT